MKRKEFKERKETKQKHFLVKYNKDWVDLETGIKFKPLKIDYDDAQEGLCNKKGKLVLKFYKGSRHPLVMIAKEVLKPEIKLKPIKVYAHAPDKHKIEVVFHPQTVIEVLKGLEDGKTEYQMSVRAGCSKEAVLSLIDEIDKRGLELEKILGGDKFDRNDTKRGHDNITGLSYDMRY